MVKCNVKRGTGHTGVTTQHTAQKATKTKLNDRHISYFNWSCQRSRTPTVFLVLVVDDRIAGRVDFLDVAFEIKHFRYNDLEDSLDIDRMGSGTEDERSLHGLGKTDGLFRNVLFLFLLHGGEVVELGANQERECGLIQQPCLLVPVLHGRQRALARKIKHEEQSHGVVANERQHVEVLLLASQVPDTEGDIGVL